MKTTTDKPIAYQHGRTDTYVHLHCWNEFDQEYKAKTDHRASIGDLFYEPHARLRGAHCPVCHEPIVDKFRFDCARAIQKRLVELLPDWHFEPYGRTGAVACYPPHPYGVCPRSFVELNEVAFISGVCGPLYTVYSLR